MSDTVQYVIIINFHYNKHNLSILSCLSETIRFVSLIENTNEIIAICALACFLYLVAFLKCRDIHLKKTNRRTSMMINEAYLNSEN